MTDQHRDRPTNAADQPPSEPSHQVKPPIAGNPLAGSGDSGGHSGRRAAPIFGVILAAGSSSRLGRPKQLLPLGDRPVLAHTVANALAASFDGLIVVLGHAADAIRAQIDFGPARVAVNDRYREGQSTSLHAGVAALPPEVAAAVFILGDQPLIGPAVHDALIAAYRDTAALIVQPSYDGERGNPVLFAASLFPKLLQVVGDQGARNVIRAHATEILAIPIPGPTPTDDLDTEDDYQRLLARHAAVRAR